MPGTCRKDNASLGRGGLVIWSSDQQAGGCHRPVLAAQQLGVSRSTLWRWQDDASASGAGSLNAKPSSINGLPKPVPSCPVPPYPRTH